MQRVCISERCAFLHIFCCCYSVITCMLFYLLMLLNCVTILVCRFVFFFFFKQKTDYEMRISDWSSDVCSSDLETVPPAAELTGFPKTAYEQHGETGLFDRAAEAFAIDPKYRIQFERMHRTAQLPAKLLLYQSVLDLMHTADQHGKRLFIFTTGDPAMQLNKLRHVEWNGLDRSVKVYFGEELQAKGHEPLDYLLQENGLQTEDVLYIHAGDNADPGTANRVDCQLNKG